MLRDGRRLRFGMVLRAVKHGELCGGGLDFGAVVEAGVPLAATLWGEVQEVPDGSEQVDATLLDLGCHSRMRGVEMARGAVGIARENGNGGVLVAFAVFAA